jgi:hypothetical protein
LERLVPFFKMGVTASVEVAGELLQSAGNDPFRAT